jgi:hypothetical protein
MKTTAKRGTHRIMVRFTDQEWDWLESEGNLLGRSPAEVARLCVDAAIVGVGTVAKKREEFWPKG